VAQVKRFGKVTYKLVKQTPYKGEAQSTRDAYKRDYKVRMEKKGNVWYVWAAKK